MISFLSFQGLQKGRKKKLRSFIKAFLTLCISTFSFTIRFSTHNNLVFALTLHKTATAKGILTQFLTNSYEYLSFLKLCNSFFWKLFFGVAGIKSYSPVVHSWYHFLLPLISLLEMLMFFPILISRGVISFTSGAVRTVFHF